MDGKRAFENVWRDRRVLYIARMTVYIVGVARAESRRRNAGGDIEFDPPAPRLRRTRIWNFRGKAKAKPRGPNKPGRHKRRPYTDKGNREGRMEFKI